MTPRTLTAADLPGAYALSCAAGWNQTEDDWRQFTGGSRASHAAAWGIEENGRLVSTTTAAGRDDGLVWIGMVLTHPEARRRGFARRVMQHAMEEMERRGRTWFGLDATDAGRPLYEQIGFAACGTVERWQRPGTAPREGTPGGAFHRPGRVAHYFGPCTMEKAEERLRELIGIIGDQSCYWDLAPEHAGELARRHGFLPVRRLTRMTRGGPAVPPDPSTAAYPGFEWPPPR